jgi:hypothetical protein
LGNEPRMQEKCTGVKLKRRNMRVFVELVTGNRIYRILWGVIWNASQNWLPRGWEKAFTHQQCPTIGQGWPHWYLALLNFSYKIECQINSASSPHQWSQSKKYVERVQREVPEHLVRILVKDFTESITREPEVEGRQRVSEVRTKFLMCRAKGLWLEETWHVQEWKKRQGRWKHIKPWWMWYW